MFSDINTLLAGKPRGIILATGWALILVIGVVDYWTGTAFEFDIFYLVPIFLVTWYGRRLAGISTAILATLVWVAIDQAKGRLSPQWLVSTWNELVEFGFFFAVVYLLAALKDQTRKLEELATRDPLTGIANRRSFLSASLLEIHRCERFGTPFTAVYFDLDNFKQVNDTQGHSRGDFLLCEVTAVLRQNIRDIDTAGRLGGDEFAILLPGTDSASVKPVIERIHGLLLEAMAREGWPVTFSIGVVTFLMPPASLDEMVETIDAIMYSVKKSGKNGVAYGTWPSPG